MSWFDAKNACTARGEQLAQPETQGKNQFLTEKLRTAQGITGDGVWFGASRNPQNISQWQYTDGSELAYTSWASGISTISISMHINIYISFKFVSNYILLNN